MFLLQNPGSGSSTPGSTPTAAAAAAAAAASAWRWISPPTGGGGGAAGSCQQQQQQTAGSQYSQQQAAAVAAVNQALSYAQVHQVLLLVFPSRRKIGRVIQKRPIKNVCSRINCAVAGGKSDRLRTSSTFSSKEQRRLASFVVLCFLCEFTPKIVFSGTLYCMSLQNTLQNSLTCPADPSGTS